MKSVHLRAGLAAAALALAAADAHAADATFRAPKGDVTVEEWNGQPLWRIQAYCAGVLGASNNWYADHGMSDRADGAARDSRRLLDAAAARLAADRGLARAEAENLAKVAAGTGFDQAESQLREGGLTTTTTANLNHSKCLTVRDMS